jgi:hypothetical protein
MFECDSFVAPGHMRRVPLSDDCTEAAILTFLHKFQLVTVWIYPPIPDRSNDWGVYIEGDEEAGTWTAATEGEAISDFIENYEA